ncbi:8208_t:CDS:2 [Cetraspora pellucida]|uniref:8208_t:CDS:1 n=2 Tax=Cetraspora pellucida TaxID=1433469 RepID=A0ACA9LYH9_9GLOM|nr:8208_t:CDS:2 [Cetraspora pellucida]
MFELWWHFEAAFSRFFCIKYETVVDKNLMLTHIGYDDYVKLPNFTWEEINERVQHGAYLVVCEGLVVDIRSFYDSHPGGSKVLLPAIGTDITNDFYNTHENKIVEVTDSSEALSIPKDITSKKYSSVLAKHVNHLQGKPKPRSKMTAAKFVDNINVNFYSREPLAQHAHSRFAIQKMTSMVIGKVNEKMSEKGKNIKFHRYRLTSKKMINANVEYPVMKFTFSNIHQVNKDIYSEKFLPGHYIEVQSRVNGQIVIRSYIPLEGSLSKSFTIYVKIYPMGLFSQYLNEQLIGYEIQARGPFDVCDRAYLAPTLAESLNSRLSILPSIKPLIPYSKLTGMSSTAKTSLLNPDSPDGCWDELYMIAGGTGITPMLQRSMTQESNTNEYAKHKRMHLLFGNRKIEDVIDGIFLEDLALSSQGQLTVTYCLSEPPSNWDGLQGRINKQMIQDWMNMMRGVFIRSPNKSQKSILHSHSIRHDANEHNWSHSPTLKPQSLYLEPKASTKESTLNIDLDLANSEKSDNLIQGKIIVSGPSSMLAAVEQDLLEIGFNEQNMIILY